MKRLVGLWNKHTCPTVTAEVIPPMLVEEIKRRPPLLERKHRVGKSTQEFLLENWSSRLVREDVCVGRWVSDGNSSYGSPRGSYSWGVWFCKGHMKEIGAYRIHDRFGNLMCYRLDVVTDVCFRRGHDIERSSLEFFDLIVDCWLWPTNSGCVDRLNITIDDLDELDKKSHLLTSGNKTLINNVIYKVLSEPDIVVSDIDAAIEETYN